MISWPSATMSHTTTPHRAWVNTRYYWCFPLPSLAWPQLSSIQLPAWPKRALCTWYKKLKAYASSEILRKTLDWTLIVVNADRQQGQSQVPWASHSQLGPINFHREGRATVGGNDSVDDVMQFDQLYHCAHTGQTDPLGHLRLQNGHSWIVIPMKMLCSYCAATNNADAIANNCFLGLC